MLPFHVQNVSSILYCASSKHKERSMRHWESNTLSNSRPLLSPSPFSSSAACRSQTRAHVYVLSSLLLLSCFSRSSSLFLSVSPSLVLHYALLRDVLICASVHGRRARACTVLCKKNAIACAKARASPRTGAAPHSTRARASDANG